MHCLEEIRLSFRTKEYLEHPDKEPTDEPLMRTLTQGPAMQSVKSTKVRRPYSYLMCQWIFRAVVVFPTVRQDLLILYKPFSDFAPCTKFIVLLSIVLLSGLWLIVFLCWKLFHHYVYDGNFETSYNHYEGFIINPFSRSISEFSLLRTSQFLNVACENSMLHQHLTFCNLFIPISHLVNNV